jgi:hypothetical protein
LKSLQGVPVPFEVTCQTADVRRASRKARFDASKWKAHFDAPTNALLPLSAPAPSPQKGSQGVPVAFKGGSRPAPTYHCLRGNQIGTITVVQEKLLWLRRKYFGSEGIAMVQGALVWFRGNYYGCPSRSRAVRGHKKQRPPRTLQ